MLVPNQVVEVKWHGKNKDHFINIGYTDYKSGKTFMVKVEDLPLGSNTIVKFLCDNCNDEIETAYRKKSNSENHFCCKKCETEYYTGKVKLEKRTGKNVNCYNCNENFYLPKYRIESQDRYFCCDDCRMIWMKSKEYSDLISDIKGSSLIKTNCKFCDKEIEKIPSEFIGHGKHYCSRSCVAKDRFKDSNPNPKKEKITVTCNQCNKEMKVNESVAKKNKWHFCSRQCYSLFRSENLTGENSPSYEGLKVNCDNCGEYCDTIKSKIDKNKNIFCSQNCYYEYRSKHYSGKNHPQYGIKKTPEQIEHMRFVTAKRISEGGFPQTNTSINKKIESLLHKINVNFKNEELFKYYSVDFYLPDYNIVIEVNGDFWHANPLKYRNFNELSKIQKKDVKRDKSKNTYLKKYHNCKVLYLWEYDVNNNIELCEKLINYIIENDVNDVNSINYNLINNNLIKKEDITIPYFLIKNYPLCDTI